MSTNFFSRQGDIKILLKRIESHHQIIKKVYQSSLEKKQIDSAMEVDIKNQFENFRSVLDYLSCDIGVYSELKKGDTYFPILNDRPTFVRVCNGWFPKLKTKNPDLYNYLEAKQPYHGKNRWLGDFATILNDYKHKRLVPQMRVDIPAITLAANNASIQLSGGATIDIGHGASISLGDAKICDGQIISAHSSFIKGDPRLKIMKEIWVDFQFNGSVSAMTLLERLRTEVPLIVDAVYKLMS